MPLSPSQRAARSRSYLMCAIMVASVLVPQATMADPTNITTGLNSLETWLISAAKIIAVIAFIGCGLAKMVGRMQWNYFFSVMAGCAIVFGAAELATWFEGS
jgi:type IV secretory pathway VirB2 component (pilin)